MNRPVAGRLHPSWWADVTPNSDGFFVIAQLAFWYNDDLKYAYSWRLSLSRVINPESAGKERNQLMRAVALALRELMKQTEADAVTRDLAAFITLALAEIAGSIDPSVAAWEKRGYWVKADRFRMEWDWAGRLGTAMHKALDNEDWLVVAQVSAQVAVKVNDTKLPQHHRLGTPWVGAWQRLQQVKIN